mmetsp:Transcript_28524/g.55664  ORF Transcript_28524/g.55664 Transcript_28524/m.55664 type:complete len:100 (+) Transcript_28524:684-983(+)
MPSFLLQNFFWRIIIAVKTFFLNSGFPFLTVANTISPMLEAGNLLSLPFIRVTAIIYKFLAPVLSAQFITAPTGKPKEVRNLFPTLAPLPLFPIYKILI